MCKNGLIHVACIQWHTMQLFKMRDEFTCSNIKDAFKVLHEERNSCLVWGRGGYICYLNFQPHYK